MDQNLVCIWYERHKNSIFRYAFSILKDQQLAEDVLHDTFVKLLSVETTCAPGKEQAWLYRIARNLCYDRLRRTKRELSLIKAPACSDTYFEYIDLISALSPKEQEIVTLKIIGGLSHREVGAVLGITPAAAQKRYERAIAILREKEVSNGTETV